VLTKIDPIMPASAPPGFEGSVMLSIVVGTDGKAENVQVVKSLDPTFDASAIDAVQQWVFRPGMNQGVAVKVRAQIEMNFRKI
jgi:TonB family protein